MPNDKTFRAVQLTESLRAWLRAHADYEPDELAAALTYELAAIIATHAKTVEDAHHLLGHTFHTMREQFRELGVGPQRADPYP
jgi:hypothetical protein